MLTQLRIEHHVGARRKRRAHNIAGLERSTKNRYNEPEDREAIVNSLYHQSMAFKILPGYSGTAFIAAHRAKGCLIVLTGLDASQQYGYYSNSIDIFLVYAWAFCMAYTFQA